MTGCEDACAGCELRPGVPCRTLAEPPPRELALFLSAFEGALDWLFLLDMLKIADEVGVQQGV